MSSLGIARRNALDDGIARVSGEIAERMPSFAEAPERLDGGPLVVVRQHNTHCYR